ncbi:MAG TPA: GTPase HflX [Flavobacteriales bacterium]|jgi:GTP-binding protein HflX|nr:GTPase HflX [Flavobacteriales bacterium]
MAKLHFTDRVVPRAVLIGLVTPEVSFEKQTEYLDELAFLSKTLGIEVIKSFTQQLAHPDIRTFIGKGKLLEIKKYTKENEIDYVIFDDDLSASQMRNIEKELKLQIYDRSLLILDIFQYRAQTAQAKTQVELARYQYLLPRLTRMWTHLERQRGGTSTRGGAGEKEIETDRRIIRDKIALLKKKLKTIDKQMATQRQNRGKMVRVALVGYTNVGKSTIMNLLSKSNVFAEDKLFATLDTTVRKITIHNLPLLLTDTVGFIRKLPHQLVESFKSTLDEVREADILLHVVDISHPQFEDHWRAVDETLGEIDSKDKPTILVFNKIDQYSHLNESEFDYTGDRVHHISLKDLQASWMNRTENRSVFISAKKKENIDELRNSLYEVAKSIHASRYPYQDFLY